MFTGIRKIKVQEYTCDSARNKGTKLQKVQSNGKTHLEFTSIRLAVSIALTILSSNPKLRDFVKFSISSFINLSSMIGNHPNSKNSNLVLIDDINEMLRDFSFSTRIGELAQGISFMFAQDILEKPHVVDFDGYAKSQKHSFNKTVKSSPDFVLHDLSNLRKITLLESKGSTRNQVNNGLKSTLKKALQQCEDGKVSLSSNNVASHVENSYGVAVLFSKESDTWDSCIHFVDPFSDSEGELENPESLIKYHYSSWFMLVGLEKQAVALANGENIEITLPKRDEGTVVVKGNKYYLFENSNIFGDCSLGKSGCFGGLDKVGKFGISSEILDRLTGIGGKKFDEEVPVFEPYSDDNYEVFRDGMLFKYEGVRL